MWRMQSYCRAARYIGEIFSVNPHFSRILKTPSPKTYYLKVLIFLYLAYGLDDRMGNTHTELLLQWLFIPDTLFTNLL
jgi:hypothetical protein